MKKHSVHRHCLKTVFNKLSRITYLLNQVADIDCPESGMADHAYKIRRLIEQVRLTRDEIIYQAPPSGARTVQVTYYDGSKKTFTEKGWQEEQKRVNEAHRLLKQNTPFVRVGEPFVDPLESSFL